ncbi:MAG: hypothetical protein IJO79_02310 [Firmicutes bacterium]|nr:hypothetical protein [Bacillota bacterium]
MKKKKKPWKVYFQGNRKKGTWAGTEIPIKKKILWGDEVWHIPAVYSCSQGLVVDLCVEVIPEKVRAFIEKWQLLEPGKDRISNYAPNERMRLELENPLTKSARVKALVNGKELKQKNGSSRCWNPCLPPEFRDDARVEAYINHYGLDSEKVWVFHRVSLPWVTKNKPKIKRLELVLDPDKADIPGMIFQGAKAGISAVFEHPYTGEKHILTIEEYKEDTFPEETFRDPDMEYPCNFVSMTYSVDPEIPRGEIHLQDLGQGDRPKRRTSAIKDPYAPEAVSDAAAIGIIGGADGPAALILSRKGSLHCDCSSLYFEPPKDLSWQMVFRCKLREPVQISLLP